MAGLFNSRNTVTLRSLQLPDNGAVHPARAMNVSISNAPDRGLGCNGWLGGSRTLDLQYDRLRNILENRRRVEGKAVTVFI